MVGGRGIAGVWQPRGNIGGADRAGTGVSETGNGAVSRTSVGFRSDRGRVLLTLMLTTGLIAIDATILATAVPSVVKELGEFEQFPWLFSVYLLAQAVSVPNCAKTRRDSWLAMRSRSCCGFMAARWDPGRSQGYSPADR